MSVETEKCIVLTADDRARLLDQLAGSERMAELGRLASGVIHELNTPLSVIASAAQLILREEELPESVHELVEMIEGEAHRLSQLTRGILTFSRGNASAETEVNEVLRETLALLRYETRKRSISVVNLLEELPLPAAADAARLKQVFLNLMVNAVHAMEGGGTLTVCSSFRENAVAVEIRDTGCGIEPDMLEKVFDPFFTTKAAGEGTGLGLFVTREIVAAFGGILRVASTPGEGTSFSLLIPCPSGD